MRKRPWSPRLGSGDPIRALVRSETLKALQKARVWRLVAGGLWTRTCFEAAGYDINPMCLIVRTGLGHSVPPCLGVPAPVGGCSTEGGAKESMFRFRCGMKRHEAAHCSASHPVEKTVPSERHFRTGHVATTRRTLVPAQVPECFCVFVRKQQCDLSSRSRN